MSFFVNLTAMVSSWIPINARYILTPAYAVFTNIMIHGVSCISQRSSRSIEDSALTTTKIAVAFQLAPLVFVDDSAFKFNWV